MTFPELVEQQNKWNLVFEPLNIGLKNLGIPEKHLRSTLLVIDELALKFGWVSDWGHLTPAETDDFLKEWSDTKLSTEEKEQMISKYFIEFYSSDNFEKIDECFTNWIQNSIFSRRMPIFRDCLFALQNSTKSFNPQT